MKRSTNLITHDNIIGYNFQGRLSLPQSMLVTSDEIVGYDFQGWPVYQLRVISLLRTLGIDDEIIDKIPEEILKQHIVTGADDGMGYVPKTQKVTDAMMTKEGLCLVY